MSILGTTMWSYNNVAKGIRLLDKKKKPFLFIQEIHEFFFSRKTDKHAMDCSKAVCWGVK